jgi:signal transduction histidine kinase
MYQKQIEPGLLKVFRYFVGLAVVYFLVFFFYTARTTGTWISPNLILYYINLTTNFFLLLYLSWEWLKNHLKQYYLPIALIVAGMVPVFSSLILWPLEPGSNLTAIIFRSWTLIPVLIVPVVLIAWQYGYNPMVAFVIITFLYDLPFILFSIDEVNLDTIPILGVPFIRSLAFGTVGHIVIMLMDTQRNQRKELINANLQLAQHAKTLEQLATSRERNRLARELHDTLAHTLSGQIVTLEALKLDINHEDIQMTDTINQLLDSARTGLAETRRALKDLRSKQLEDLGLSIALTNLIFDAAARSNAEPVISIQKDIKPISHDLEQCIFRISQEALENIVRHANATKIDLKIFENNHRLWLTISDNGKGFYPQTTIENNLGLKGMKERAQEHEGNFSVSSSPFQGTSIQVDFEVSHD